MPQPTYTPLATVTLGSSASSVTFSSIPATYRDLVLTVSSPTANVLARFNGDSTAHYSRVTMSGNGSTATSASTTADTALFLTAGSGGFCVAQIMDYSVTNKHKTALRRRNDATSVLDASAIRWPNTSAITSLALAAASGDLASGSTFNLYGIAG
jgi:hypothetical protein